MKRIRGFCIASGLGARDDGCSEGAWKLRELPLLHQRVAAGQLRWEAPLQPPLAEGKLKAIIELASQLASGVRGALKAGEFPLVLGGDHSCAIGTWSGVKAALPDHERLGLLWLDAHMDSHTFRSSPSHALHGMPLACLLGQGKESLTQLLGPAPKLKANDVALVGVRSYEHDEAKRLRRLDVRVRFMPDIRRRGLAATIGKAIDHISRYTVGFGLSLDLDVLDPDEEPGVGSPAPNGLRLDELLAALTPLKDDPRLLALEIVEYNPHHDQEGRTARAAEALMRALLPSAPVPTSAP